VDAELEGESGTSTWEAEMEPETKRQAKPSMGAALLVVHEFLTRGMDVSIDHIEEQRQVPVGEARKGFADYLHCLSSLLNAHHITEDEIAFPYLRKLIPDAPYDMLSADHKIMEPLIERLDTFSAQWKAGDDEKLDELDTTLQEFKGIWHPHIAVEQKFYEPTRLEGLIEPEEHTRLIQQMSQYTQQHSDPPFLIVPFILYNIPADKRTMLTSQMPPQIIEQLVPIDWKDQWAPMKPFLLE